VDDVIVVAEQFQGGAGAVQSVTPYGSGNINDTYLVRLEGDRETKFILQRINQKVFPYPRLIMVNLRAIGEHVAAKSAPDTHDPSSDRRWELPRIVPSRTGEDYLIDGDDFWRALTFVEGARTYPKVTGPDHAGEAGYALGKFQALISDLDVAQLHDTLPGFHIMPHYLAHYHEVLAAPAVSLAAPEVRYGMAFVAEREAWAPVLQAAQEAGRLQSRPIHGDPKIDNIMIDDETGLAVSLIDLDTVKPGLVQYDIGDCLRSSCNPLGEETHEIEQVSFELDLCETILKGYLPQVRDFYTPHDYAYVYDAVRVLAFEMGLRFFTDYLEGDVYFKTRYPEHNLMRALVQFHLMASIEAQEAAIRTMVRALTPDGVTL
jgi:Ser/Thr protein kinase RdoA (MazF antagonist)